MSRNSQTSAARESEVNFLICQRNSVPYTISMGTPESTKAIKQLIFARPIAKAAKLKFLNAALRAR